MEGLVPLTELLEEPVLAAELLEESVLAAELLEESLIAVELLEEPVLKADLFAVELEKMLQSKTKDKMETDAKKDPQQKPKKTEKLTFQVKVDELVKLAQKKEAHLAVVLDVQKLIALRVKADVLKVDKVEEDA